MTLTLEIPADLAADIQREAAAWGTTVEAHALAWLVAARGDWLGQGKPPEATQVEPDHEGHALIEATNRALDRKNDALAAIESLTGWSTTVDIEVDPDGNVKRFRMEMRTRAMGGAGARKLFAHMDHIGRCVMEVEEDADPGPPGASFRQRQQSLSTPLPILLHRRRPDGPRNMLKLAAQYVADNPTGGRAPLRIDVLNVAAALLEPAPGPVK